MPGGLVYQDSENIRKVVKDIFSGAVKKNPYYPLSGPRLGTFGPPQLVIQALGVQLELNKPLAWCAHRSPMSRRKTWFTRSSLTA